MLQLCCLSIIWYQPLQYQRISITQSSGRHQPGPGSAGGPGGDWWSQCCLSVACRLAADGPGGDSWSQSCLSVACRLAADMRWRTRSVRVCAHSTRRWWSAWRCWLSCCSSRPSSSCWSAWSPGHCRRVTGSVGARAIGPSLSYPIKSWPAM